MSYNTFAKHLITLYKKLIFLRFKFVFKTKKNMYKSYAVIQAKRVYLAEKLQIFKFVLT